MQINLQNLYRFQKVVISDHQIALLFRDGKFERVLPSGKHRFYHSGYQLKTFERREQMLAAQGQELLSSDQVTLKVTAMINYRVEDALLLHTTISEPLATLHFELQLALRHVVGTLTAEEFLQQKATQGAALVEALEPRLTSMGLKITRADVRDVMLPSALKKSFMSALQQRQEAQASLEKARAETATLRTLANAARLLRENPELLSLRYMETLKEINTSGKVQLNVSYPEFSLPS